MRPGEAGRFLVGEGNPSSEADVRSVLHGTSRSKVIGYDLIISAARPISSLLAVGTVEEQRSLVALHQAAVADVMRYLEDRALVTTSLAEGVRYEEPSRFSRVVAFTHGINRAGDPHLHDHVLFGSADREQGRAIDRRSLLGHLETADALYHAQLREGLTRLGRLAWRDFQGRDHVEGIDAGTLALWPAHRDRSMPKVAWTRSEAVNHWSRRLHHRLDVPTPTPPPVTTSISEHSFAAHFEGRHSIGRRHLVQAFANAAAFGVAVPEVEQLVSFYYPELADQRGVGEKTITQHAARQLERIRVFGARPVSYELAQQWSQRARERDTSSRTR